MTLSDTVNACSNTEEEERRGKKMIAGTVWSTALNDMSTRLESRKGLRSDSVWFALQLPVNYK